MSLAKNKALFICLFVTLACVVAFYIHYMSATSNWTCCYYEKLGNAFLSGQAYLHEEPSSQLLALPNPYNPSERDWKIGRIEDTSAFNSDIGFLWDAVLFNGKYYLYFGPVPALIPWIPAKLLFDLSLTDLSICLIYLIVGSVSLCVLFFLVFQAIKPRETPPFATCMIWFITVLPLIIGTGVTLLLKRPMFYEAAIAGAYAYNSLGLLLLWMGFVRPSVLPALKPLGSLCLGLAAGCRLLHGLNIIFLIACWLAGRKDRPFRKSMEEACLLFLPWLSVILMYALYNYVRFGSFYETGMSYQLTVADLQNIETSRSWGSFIHNLQGLLFSLIDLNILKPWHQNFGTARPENVLGLLPYAPFVLWGILGMLFMHSMQRIISASLICLWLYALCCLIFIASHTLNVSGRYLADFAPWLMLASSMTFVHLAFRPQPLSKRNLLIGLGLFSSAWTSYSVIAAFSRV